MALAHNPCPRRGGAFSDARIQFGFATAEGATLVDGAFGPLLPVGLTQCCFAAFPEADIGLYCSNLAPQVTAWRTEPPLTHWIWKSAFGSQSHQVNARCWILTCLQIRTWQLFCSSCIQR